MKQFVQLALLCGVLGVAVADKRPFQPRRGQGFAPFAFQRQTEGTGDLAPPPPPPGGAPPGGAPPAAPGNYKPGGDDAGGPYPPSGQPESGSGPYPPSGWKPEGQRLELPARQQKPPQNGYGAPPKQPQQQYGAPPKQPQQQYGAPPKQPAEPEAPEAADGAEPATESPDAAASNRLRNQLRQQRIILQRMRQLVRDQQAQLQQQRHEQQALVEQLQQLRGDVQQQGGQQGGEQAAQGQYVVSLPDGRVQRVQYANTPSSTSVFKQNVHQTEAVPVQGAAQRSPQGFPSSDPQTYVARLQFMDVPPIEAPVFSYAGSAPLVRVA